MRTFGAAAGLAEVDCDGAMPAEPALVQAAKTKRLPTVSSLIKRSEQAFNLSTQGASQRQPACVNLLGMAQAMLII